MNFKFFRGEEDMGRLIFYQPRPLNINNVEFCFQFDDEEPIMFASGPNSCNITINTNPEGNITFTDNGRRFKLFARERQ